ncbi:hypothetical protein [Glutamicibacter sp. NPDC087344]|uniref:hypothetical protein n=1 Tax=Glutamicibacter sp. NPDC087344 TaxID=3363994 RepID=UPI00382AC52E
MSAPTRGGQAVRFIRTGELGITTDEPAKRSPSIAVQLLGRHYPVYLGLEEIELIEIAELTA